MRYYKTEDDIEREQKTEQKALEAAIWAYVTSKDGLYARTTAALTEEAFDKDDFWFTHHTMQTNVGGSVLGKAWASTKNADLDTAISDYMTSQGDRLARSAAAFKEEAHISNRVRMRTRSGGGATLQEAWVRFIKQRDFEDDDAIFNAIESGDLAEVQLCVWMGARLIFDPDTFPYRRPPTVCAADSNGLEIMKYLAEFCALDESDRWGVNPLMVACIHGNAAIAEYLLDDGCYMKPDEDRGQHIDERLMDIRDDDGATALHWAALHGHIEVAQVLFRYGAKLDVKDHDGRTPAEVAIQRGHHAFADAVRAEEIRRRDHGFKRDRSTIEGTEEHEAAKRPRVEAVEEPLDESDDDDDDDEEEG